MGQNKERLHYIDIAKGLLCIVVIFGHVTYLYFLINDRDYGSPLMQFTDTFFWFAMPAFVALSGFFTKYSKGFRSFLIRNFKGLLFANMSLSILFSYMEQILYSNPFALKSFFFLQFRNIIFRGGVWWFLSALFICKIICYVLELLKIPAWARLILLTCLFFVGFYFYSNEYINVWMYQHAFMLVIFLYIGSYLRQIQLKKTTMYMVSVFFVIFCIAYRFMGYSFPIVAGGTIMTYMEIVPYIVGASIGIVVLLFLSKSIGNSPVIEYVGRNTLVFYVSHPLFIGIFIRMFNDFQLGSLVIRSLHHIVITILTLGCCYITSLILNTKYLKFIKGDF